MEQRKDRVVRFIGAFRLLKAGLLLASGVAAQIFLPGEIAARLHNAVISVGVAPGHDWLSHLTGRLWSLDPSTARHLGILAIFYAAVFSVEGVGLMLRQRWAEWLTVIVTASFIPIEIYELARHFGAAKVLTLILNVAIVVYLVARRLHERRAHRRPAGGPARTK